MEILQSMEKPFKLKMLPRQAGTIQARLLPPLKRAIPRSISMTKDKQLATKDCGPDGKVSILLGQDGYWREYKEGVSDERNAIVLGTSPPKFDPTTGELIQTNNGKQCVNNVLITKAPTENWLTNAANIFLSAELVIASLPGRPASTVPPIPELEPVPGAKPPYNQQPPS